MDEGRLINIYAVKDELVGRFMQPIYFQTHDEAIRWFNHQVQEIPLWKSNPADYGLYSLGSLHEGSGTILSCVEKIASGTGARKE